jgi:transcription elongation factor Elf1
MASKILTCPECESTKIKDLNPELKEIVEEPTVQIKAKCENCGEEFEYPSATTWGKSHIFY